MPELPEVETVVRDLRPLLAGRTVIGPSGESRAEAPSAVAQEVERAGDRSAKIMEGILAVEGKWIVVDLISRGTRSGKKHRSSASISA